MSYNNINELPKNVTDNLPDHAQKVYMRTYNNAFEQYADPDKRRGGKNESREEVSHQVAWNAVKHKYKKDENGKWVKK